MRRDTVFMSLMLALMLVIDVMLIYLSFTVDRSFITYLPNGSPISLSPRVDVRMMLEGEGSYGELFQYIKEGLIILLLLGVYLRTSAPLALLGVGLFGYVILDDSLGIHEGVAFAAKEQFGDVWFGLLGKQSVNELLVFAFVGALFLVLGVFAYRRSTFDERRVAAVFGVLLGLLGVCGVGFDVLHVLFKSSQLIPVLEDGGEMLLMSGLVVAAAGTFALTWNVARRPALA